LYMFW